MSNRTLMWLLAICFGGLLISAIGGWPSMTSEQRLIAVAGLLIVLGGILAAESGWRSWLGCLFACSGAGTIFYLMLNV